MRSSTWMPSIAIAFLVGVAGAAMAQDPATASGTKGSAGLTPEQQALVTQASDLGKQVRIAQLELRLAEAKEASESEIAAKAENVYRLRAKLHALAVKHPELALRGAGRGEGHGWRHGRAGGRGCGGPAMGRGQGGGHAWGGASMGRGRGEGRAWGGPAMGGGRGMGHGPGSGWGGRGESMGRGTRLRDRLRLHQPDATVSAPAPPETKSD